MSNSLVKFTDRKDGNGRGNLFWGRADVDGLPFRGKHAPSFRQDEFDERVVRVADPKNSTFHTGNEDENAAYLKVMDGIANGWFHLVFIERWREEGDKKHYIYMEWVEYFLEDGSPAQYSNPGSTGM